MTFSTLFQLHHRGQCTYTCCPQCLLPALHKILFSSHKLLSHITIDETTLSGERGMNPVTMIIINPRKEEIAEKGIEPVTSCFQVLHANDCATQPRGKGWVKQKLFRLRCLSA